MAHAWLDADRQVVMRLAHLVELVWRGDFSAAVLREVRLYEDALGLTPYGRRRLEWSVAEQAPALSRPARFGPRVDPRVKGAKS